MYALNPDFIKRAIQQGDAFKRVAEIIGQARHDHSQLQNCVILDTRVVVVLFVAGHTKREFVTYEEISDYIHEHDVQFT
ncbi:hypothetical protein MYOV011v1_p0012 [Vibrio phage 6E35.1a]|nr:hypothetical protein MYOV011v1_p0012 [Vibrio phage 6E35.1a]